jgi:phosphoglycolate phosphatase
MFHPCNQYSHVVFDWNGTIVDDVMLALRSVNKVRSDIGLGAVSLATYRDVFRFPISEFYTSLGFDFARTPFADLITRYLSYFDAEIEDCPLSCGFHDLTHGLRQQGTRISVLSASHQDTLARAARSHALEPLIDNLFGLDDSIASGKISRARELDRRLDRHASSRVLMVGDTDHDYDVACDRGWDFVAVACGHQSSSRLVKLGAPVYDGLTTLAQAILHPSLPVAGR